MYETTFMGREGPAPQVLESETMIAELATELLSVNSEEELDQFLGKLARSVVRGASKFVRSPIGRALGGVLKNVAKTALPAVGGALGSFVAPGIGTAIGTKLGSMASGLLETGELESLGEAEAEFEAAQRYVRFARSAYANAARAPRRLPPRAVARASTVAAARRHAPGLLRDRGGNRGRPGARPSGDDRWRGRRGRRRPPAHRPVFRPLPWGLPWMVAGNDGYAWPGYGGTGWPPPEMSGQPGSEPEPEPGTEPSDSGPDDGQEAAGPGGPRAARGQWIRRGQHLVVLGV